MLALQKPTLYSIAELERIVATLPYEGATAVIASNHELVHRLGQPDIACALFEEILNSRTLLEKIAGRSYQHVNQFDKIVLVGNHDPHAYRITLHLWTPPYPPDVRAQELIHGHRFHFWSTVLLGRVISENYVRTAEGGTMFREYRYTPELRGQAFQDFYEYVGDARLTRSGSYEKDAGHSYYLDTANIHRISLPAELSCTLVLRGPRLQAYSNVFNTTYPSENTQLPNQMFTAAQLGTRLRMLVAAIWEHRNERRV